MNSDEIFGVMFVHDAAMGTKLMHSICVHLRSSAFICVPCWNHPDLGLTRRHV